MSVCVLCCDLLCVCVTQLLAVPTLHVTFAFHEEDEEKAKRAMEEDAEAAVDVEVEPVNFISLTYFIADYLAKECAVLS